MTRRIYVDWLRGLAVVIMVFAHTMDSWTRTGDRANAWYDLVVKIAGMAAPLFLFLAGVSVSLAARRDLAGSASAWGAGRAMRRRGWEILGLALLFRFQAWLVSPGATVAGMLKVDILNVMGPSIVLAATLWSLGTTTARRAVLLAGAASAFSLLTPLVRGSDVLGVLPDWLEWYLRPPQGRGWFASFPWAGLLLGGAVAGEILASGRDETGHRRVLLALGVWGTLLSLVSFVGSYFPSIYSNTYFWTTSPSYFFLRIGLMTLLLPLAWWRCRSWSTRRFSPLVQLGRTSLFIYWIHVEIVYGILTWPLHRQLPLAVSLAAFVAFTLLMLWASVVKTRIVARWNSPSPGGGQPEVPIVQGV